MTNASVERAATIEARRTGVDDLVRAIKPLVGSYWLAFDRATRCHWIVEAASVHPTRGSRYASAPGSVSVVTVSSRTGEPVFVIESNDTLRWIVPSECLEICEGRFRGSQIVLQRLDDIDARTVASPDTVQSAARDDSARWIRISDFRYLEVQQCLLPTGFAAVDAELIDIEETIAARRSLPGPRDGTRSALRQLIERLDALSAHPGLTSYIWISVLREQVSHIEHALTNAA